MEKGVMLAIAVVAAIALSMGLLYWFFFMPPTTYTVTVKTVGNGRVNIGTMGAYTTTVTVDSGSTLKLEAIPDPGWKFSSWGGDVSGTSNPTTIKVEKNLTVTAIFIPTS